MRKLSSFTFITLNGFYKGANGDLSWHHHGHDENEYAEEGAQSGSILLFGRITYEMMAGYWPTPLALENNPGVAEGMNRSEKIVFSNTLQTASWSNTKIIGGNIVEEVKKRKNAPGNDMTILGSGSILSLFSEHRLIDEYQVMLDPVILAEGTTIFEKIGQKLELELISCRTFKSGVVLACYRPK